tara:strand:- start:366 stop:629 length:264 start_codon:yes stop_codon:yes gene_type:complete
LGEKIGLQHSSSSDANRSIDRERVATEVAQAYHEPAMPFQDRAMVVKVVPTCSTATLERWYIEYLFFEEAAYQEMRPRKPRKSNLDG